MEQRSDPAAIRLKKISAFRKLRLLAAAILPALLLGFVSAPRAAITAAQERFEGQWLIEYKPSDDGRVPLTLRYQEEKGGKRGDNSHSSWNWNSTSGIDPAELQGLTREQASAAAGAQVRFQIKRDAGTLECEGWFRQGSGSGHFVFSPNAAFTAELRRQGVGEPTDRQLFSLAVANVGFAFMDELKSQGYERPNVEQLVRMAHHGVRLDYLKGLKAFGYQVKTIDALVRMRDHGVTLGFIQELRDNGYTNLSAEEMVRTRDHGVSATFIREMKDEGYTLPSLEELVRLRDHGVTANFVRRVKDERGAGLTVEELIRIKNRGSY